MSFPEDIVKLRKRIADAFQVGVLNEDSKTTVEAVLIQIMNESEKNRQSCVAQAEQLRKEAAKLDGQANAFASTSSIVFNVINGYVALAERSKKEEEDRAEEMAEKAEAIKLALENDAKPEPKKVSRKKSS